MCHTYEDVKRKWDKHKNGHVARHEVSHTNVGGTGRTRRYVKERKK
jgi:hypothetical protein